MKIQIAGDIPKELMEELQKDKPSDEASYWAKPRCKHCHGTGTLGQVTTRDKQNNMSVREELCVCASRGYKKWQREWLEARTPKKTVSSKGNGEKELSEEERYDLVRDRVEKLQDSERAFISEMGGIEQRIVSLPQHAVIAGFEEQIKADQEDRVVAQRALDEAYTDLEQRRLSVEWLERQLKEKKREIARREQNVLPVLSREVDRLAMV
jgi:hypothetical protein